MHVAAVAAETCSGAHAPEDGRAVRLAARRLAERGRRTPCICVPPGLGRVLAEVHAGEAAPGVAEARNDPLPPENGGRHAWRRRVSQDLLQTVGGWISIGWWGAVRARVRGCGGVDARLCHATWV